MREDQTSSSFHKLSAEFCNKFDQKIRNIQNN